MFYMEFMEDLENDEGADHKPYWEDRFIRGAKRRGRFDMENPKRIRGLSSRFLDNYEYFTDNDGNEVPVDEMEDMKALDEIREGEHIRLEDRVELDYWAERGEEEDEIDSDDEDSEDGGSEDEGSGDGEREDQVSEVQEGHKE